MSENFDFGFTMVNEDELDIVQKVTTEAKETTTNLDNVQNKCDTLYNMIMPLLNNLAANPEKDYIKWNGQDRMAKIEEFRDKLDSVYNA